MSVGLLGAADVRRLAAGLDLRPTKSLGQNFVVDANTVRRIVATAGVVAGDAVLEVGPGLGSLTLGLLEAGAQVTAVEIDPRLAGALAVTVTDRLGAEAAGRLHVCTADALRVDATTLGATGPAPTALVANLPYNVAVPVVLHLLELLPSLTRGLVMVQAEVADRLAAPPGSRTYGIPSAKVAWWAAARRAGDVGRSVFWPAPNVDSALVALSAQSPPETTATRREVFAVIDAAFAQRRKTVRAALVGGLAPAAVVDAGLAAAGIDPRIRGEQLDVAAFARIAEGLAGAKAAGAGGAASAGDDGQGARA